MEPEVESTFCQSDLPCIAFTAFQEMQKTGEFCDLTIKVQNYSISAHRVIVAAVIPFFLSAKTETKDIAIEGLDPRAVQLLIRFAYSSKVNISTENVQSLLAASQFFQLIQVQDACVEFLMKRISVGNVLEVRTSLTGACRGTEIEEKDIVMGDLVPNAIELLIRFADSNKVNISTENVQPLLVVSQFFQLIQIQDACVEFLMKRFSVGNVLQVRTFALSLNNTNLIENSNRYIRENFDEIWKSEGFMDLSYSHVKEIISDDDLSVSREEIVLDAVMTWVKRSPSERCGSLRELLSEVRMIYISSDSLEEISREELVRSSPFCRDLLEEVKNYHLWPKKRSLFKNLKLQSRKSYALNEDIYEGIFAICQAESFDYRIISVYYRDFIKEVWYHLESKTFRFSSCYYVTAVKEKMYILSKNRVECFDPKTHEWTSIKYTQELTVASAVVSHKNKIYILGSHKCYLNRTCQVCCFDTQLEKWSEQRKMKTGRSYAAAASLGECIYVTGGIDSKFISLVSAEKYNSSTGEWSEIAPMLNKRNDHGCTSMNGKIYVCGGTGSSKTEVYDPLTDQWSFISSMEGERYGFTLLSHNSRLYAFGGRGWGDMVRNDAEIYDSESDQWKISFSLPAGFFGAVHKTVDL